jgi:hypothetical protein
MRSASTLLLVLALSLAACGQSPQEQADRWKKQRARITSALLKKTDPDSLAAAGLLSFENPERMSDLLARAVASAPERADLLWVEARACEKQPACDPGPLDRRLRTVDAQNGAAWLSALARAEALHDEAARDAALAAISRSTRVDIYWTTLIARLTSAAAQTGVIPLREAEESIIGVLGAQAIPALHTVSESCKGDRLQRPDVVEVCRGIAQALENGDTYIIEMFGVSIAKRVWPEHSSEWTAATGARRVYEYRAKLMQGIESKGWDERAARSFLTLCAENHREQDVFRAQLVAAGQNPDPPRN